MSDVATILLDGTSGLFTPRHGEPVTPWRLELASLQHSLSAYILAHADPEEALRAAHDTAADLAHEVKQGLIREHGRTFDSLFDGRRTTAEDIKLRPPGTAREKIMLALAEAPGLSRREISEIVRGKPGPTGGSIAQEIMFMTNEGLLEKSGVGIRHEPYTYRLKK